MSQALVTQAVSVTTNPADGLLDASPVLIVNEWVPGWLPAAAQLSEIEYFHALDEADEHTAVFEFSAEIPSTVADDPDAIADYLLRHVRFQDEKITRANDLGQRLLADEAKRRPAPKYWDYSDSRPEDLPAAIPATHWMWSTGNIWAARANETLESWWEDDEFLESLDDRHASFLMRPIENVPTTGTLTYFTENGDEVRVNLDADEIEEA